MRYLDNVRVIRDKDSYIKNGVFKGMVGTICDAEIRDNCFHVAFVDERVKNHEFMSDESNWNNLQDDIFCEINISDLELVKDNKTPDFIILDSIPKHNKSWWCKVEDGYIINLLGEKKNKIPFDYKS